MVSFFRSGYRVIAPDFVGFGRSDKFVDWRAYTLPLHTETIVALMRQLNLSGKAYNRSICTTQPRKKQTNTTHYLRSPTFVQKVDLTNLILTIVIMKNLILTNLKQTNLIMTNLILTNMSLTIFFLDKIWTFGIVCQYQSFLDQWQLGESNLCNVFLHLDLASVPFFWLYSNLNFHAKIYLFYRKCHVNWSQLGFLSWNSRAKIPSGLVWQFSYFEHQQFTRRWSG